MRRNIKMLTSETSRPPDWYSTKNCALQYAKLLEQVDTPKRKRERGDAANQTPGEIVTKMLSKRESYLTIVIKEYCGTVRHGSTPLHFHIYNALLYYYSHLLNNVRIIFPELTSCVYM